MFSGARCYHHGRLTFGAMDYRKRLKRFYTVFVLCWIGACSIGGIAVSPARGFGAHGHARVARDIFKNLAGPEYDAIRQSDLFRNLAAVLMQAGHRISSATDDFIADVQTQDQPDELGVLARLMTASEAEVIAWLAITVIPPILAWVLGFVVIPRIAGASNSGIHAAD
jgi:hypothetical protein